jgi:hypothetical protein
MNLLHFLGRSWNQKRGAKCREIAVSISLVLAACISPPAGARAQVAPPGYQGGLRVSAGATGSGFYLQYGQRNVLGPAVLVDVDTVRRFGIEAEGRWLDFHQDADEHAETYSIGLRYHWDLGRFEPYAKGLAGFANFNFPYNYAHGRYLTVTAGGGLDFPLNRRFDVRVVDVEWQDWPQFTFGNMNSVGASAGFRVRVF